MTFLNPIFLWASFAISIPIIVHLFNFRRPKKVLFSDISFVKEVKKSVVRRLRLRQWLVLAARCLALLALVGVFANPVWVGSNSAGLMTGAVSVAIVIDDSYSMKTGNEQGEYIHQARQVAQGILNSYGRTDEFLVMSTSGLRLHYHFTDKESAQNDLKDITLSQNTTSLGKLMNLSKDIFSQCTNPNKMLYFLSDFQEATVLADSIVSSPAEGIEVQLLPLATRAQKNVYIAGAEVTTRIIEKGKPINLKLNLVNDGPDPVVNLGIKVMVQDQAIAISNQDIPPGEIRSIEMPVTPKDSGWQSGYIEIDDEVEFDNKRFFSFYVPLRERMLVVEETPAPHLRVMFGGQLLTQFAVDFVDARAFASSDLSVYKSIVLAGVKELASGMQEKLQLHLKEGKSLMYFPGEGINLTSINSFLGSIKAGTFSPETKFTTGQSASQPDLQHPVFEGVFQKEGRGGTFDAPTLWRHFKFSPDNSSVQNVILRLSNGDPVITESRPGEGQVYVFSFFPSESYSDFTLKSSGLALLVRLGLLMNQTQQQEAGFILGEDKVKRVKTRDKELIKLVSLEKQGDGGAPEEIIPEQHPQSGYVVMQFANASLTEGNYRMEQQGTFLENISFNAPDTESRLKSFTESELETFVTQRELNRVKVTKAEVAEVSGDIEVRRSGVPLWKYFLIAGALFLLTEVVLLVWKEKPA